MPGLKEDNIFRLLKQLNLSMEMTVNRIFLHDDLTAAQCDILSYLIDHERPELSATQVHTDLGLSRAAVSALLKRLRAKGYLVFQASPRDDRQKCILLTEKARQIKKEMDGKAEAVNVRIYSGFTEKEQQILEEMIKRMLFNLKSGNGPGSEKRQSGDTARTQEPAGGGTGPLRMEV